MTIALSPPRLTLDEFLQLAETDPASEFVDGQIYQKPMPQGKHSQLQFRFCSVVNEASEADEIALALPELRCTFGGRSVVPDMSVFRWNRLLLDGEGEIENSFEIPPDWTVEILSPRQDSAQVIRNILHGLNHGTEVGWLIAPEGRFVLGFLPGQQPVELVGGDRLPLLPEVDLALTVNDIFSWLKPGR